jgi:hypothetical protein
VLLSLVVAMGTGCGDDTQVTTQGPEDSSGTTQGIDTTPPPPDTTESTTAVADDTGTGTSSTGDTTTDDTTTGGEALPGQSMSQLVSSGERASNRSFTLVYTFGQPSSLQSTHTSTNFRLHGGLIGANGSPP